MAAKDEELVFRGLVTNEQFLAPYVIKLIDPKTKGLARNALIFRLRDKTLFPFSKHDTVEIVVRRRRA